MNDSDLGRAGAANAVRPSARQPSALGRPAPAPRPAVPPLPARRSGRRVVTPGDDAIAHLCQSYVAAIEQRVARYLASAASDDEWLAAIKERAQPPTARRRFSAGIRFEPIAVEIVELAWS